MSVASQAVTVATTATQLTGGDTGAKSGSFAVANNGAATVYIGGAGVTTATGFPIAAGASMGFDLRSATDEVYGIVASGTVEVRVLLEAV